MSQYYVKGAGGGGGTPITTLDGDVGSATGSTILISGGLTGLTTTAAGSTVDLTGTLGVAHGGTGDTTLVAYAPVVGGTTSTGPLQSASVGQSNIGYVLTSTGAGTVPTFQAAPGGSAARTFAYLNTTLTGVGGGGSNYHVILDSVVSNTGGAYNTTTGLYTAAATGDYLINFTNYVYGIGATNTAGSVELYINGALGANTATNPFASADATGTHDFTSSINILQHLTAGDTVGFYLYMVGTAINIFGAGGTTGYVTYASVTQVL